VIEVGAGNGINFANYPPEVTEVVAVEPEAYLREKAGQAAAAAPVPVQVVDGLADALPVPDESFDAAVFSLVLCSVPDQSRALREVHGIVTPAGPVRSALIVQRAVRDDLAFLEGQGARRRARLRLLPASIAHHVLRALGSIAGSHAGLLPPRLRRAFSLERRTGA